MSAFGLSFLATASLLSLLAAVASGQPDNCSQGGVVCCVQLYGGTRNFWNAAAQRCETIVASCPAGTTYDASVNKCVNPNQAILDKMNAATTTTRSTTRADASAPAGSPVRGAGCSGHGRVNPVDPSTCICDTGWTTPPLGVSGGMCSMQALTESNSTSSSGPADCSGNGAADPLNPSVCNCFSGWVSNAMLGTSKQCNIPMVPQPRNMTALALAAAARPAGDSQSSLLQTWGYTTVLFIGVIFTCCCCCCCCCCWLRRQRTRDREIAELLQNRKAFAEVGLAYPEMSPEEEAKVRVSWWAPTPVQPAPAMGYDGYGTYRAAEWQQWPLPQQIPQPQPQPQPQFRASWWQPASPPLCPPPRLSVTARTSGRLRPISGPLVPSRRISSGESSSSSSRSLPLPPPPLPPPIKSAKTPKMHQLQQPQQPQQPLQAQQPPDGSAGAPALQRAAHSRPPQGRPPRGKAGATNGSGSANS